VKDRRERVCEVNVGMVLSFFHTQMPIDFDELDYTKKINNSKIVVQVEFLFALRLLFEVVGCC
jgi:hypothetical protein